MIFYILLIQAFCCSVGNATEFGEVKLKDSVLTVVFGDGVKHHSKKHTRGIPPLPNLQMSKIMKSSCF